MPKILKSVQSDGGFSVSDETIIDPTRNIIDANSVKVLDISNSRTFKKEFIVFLFNYNSRCIYDGFYRISICI